MEVTSGSQKGLAGRSEMRHMFSVGKDRTTRGPLLAAFFALSHMAEDSEGRVSVEGG